jgi:sulfite exporter TauE/SafE
VIGEAFLLGLSSGTYCIMFCAPVAVPFFFSEDMDGKKNLINALLFLAGRLAGYILFGALLGFIGAYAAGYLDPVLQRGFAALGNTIIGLIMLAAGIFYNFPNLKLCKVIGKIYKPERSALLYGLLTGLSLCPPFFAAASRTFGAGGSLEGALYFFFFFLGTTIFFLPLTGVHFISKRVDNLKMIARLVLILMGGYFVFFQGFLTLI